MAAFDKIKPGDVLYDVHRQRMGNTTMARLGCWSVRVIEVNREERTALCSWNGNPPSTYREHSIKRLRRSKPKPTPAGGVR
jgi:hypothetical protein